MIKSYGGWKQLLDPDRDPARPLQISKTSTIRAILRRFHDSRAAPPNAAKSALQSTLLKPVVATLSSDAASFAASIENVERAMTSIAEMTAGVFVVHDWGSALGFNRTFRYPSQVQAIAYMEAILQSRRWEELGLNSPFHALRSDKGEQMVLDENFFVEVMLPSGILRKLSDEEMAIYRAPYRDRESRLPTLVWPRQIPIDGEPADVVAIVERYGKWLSQSTLPKLFFIGEPGRILVAGRGREFARSWPNQQVVTVKGVHYLQEDSPVELGTALATFVKSVRA